MGPEGEESEDAATIRARPARFCTAWKSPITFSWEREGNQFEILDLYAPPEVLRSRRALQRWLVRPAEERRAELTRRRIHYRALRLIPEALVPERVSFDPARDPSNDFPLVHRALARALDSELSDVFDVEVADATRTWEIKHRSFTDDFNELLRQVHWVGARLFNWICDAPVAGLRKPYDFGALREPLHIHLAFRRPDPRRTPPTVLRDWAWKVATLALLLNDRSTLFGFRSVSGIHAAYLGPYHHGTLERLAALLAAPRIAGIEETDAEGHQDGPFKYGHVALRHRYGDPEILGFEFRQVGDPGLYQVLTGLIDFLQGWRSWQLPIEDDPATLRLGRARTTGYRLEPLARLPRIGSPHVAVPRPVAERLRAVARTARTLPYQSLLHLRPVTSADAASREMLYERWTLPCMDWAAHPATSLLAPAGPLAEQTAIYCDAAAQAGSQEAVEQALARWARDADLWTLF